MNWRARALCRTRPADWWDLGDDGNRLALALCSVCPARSLCAADREYGVIRGGVAWNDHGRAAGLCGCGYPLPVNEHGRDRAECFRCDPPRNVPGGKGAEARRLVAAGLSYVAAGERLGISKTMVWKYVRRPQAVSTEEDAA